MVEFANQQREQHGLSRRDAIIAAAKVRLRPILMTTAAMALAVVPLIIAEGAGAAARYSIGLVIFAGLLVGTLLHAVRGADVLHLHRAPGSGRGDGVAGTQLRPKVYAESFDVQCMHIPCTSHALTKILGIESLPRLPQPSGSKT